MTLILSLCTPDFVVQVSDRMVTYAADGSIKDSNSNKMVLFANRMIFGYSGLAELNGIGTDEWLAKELSSPAIQSLSDAIGHVRVRATDAIAGRSDLPAKVRRLAFVGAGWAKRDQDDRFLPILCRISNYHDAQAGGLPEARDEFSSQFSIYKPPKPAWGWLELGATLPVEQKDWLHKRLKRCAAKGVGPAAVGRLFTESIRQVSKRNPRVGRDLLLGMIPRTAADQAAIGLLSADGRGGVFAGAKTLDEVAAALQPANAMIFDYIPATSSNGVQYGPRIANPWGTSLGPVTIMPHSALI